MAVQQSPVASNDSLPAWSPDGKLLAFVRDEDCGLHCESVHRALAALGGRSRKLAVGEDTGDAPAWSPDGSGLAFVTVAGQLAPGGGAVEAARSSSAARARSRRDWRR